MHVTVPIHNDIHTHIRSHQHFHLHIAASPAGYLDAPIYLGASHRAPPSRPCRASGRACWRYPLL